MANSNSNLFQVKPSGEFNFNNASEWPKWIRRWERFRQPSGLYEKEDSSQINHLIYLMGDDAEDIFVSFRFKEKMKREPKYNEAIEKFNDHFYSKVNIVYERVKFNQRVQKEGEPCDLFATDLIKLAESCAFRDLRDELIRDRILIGMRDGKLSQQLQIISDLTLERAIEQCK